MASADTWRRLDPICARGAALVWRAAPLVTARSVTVRPLQRDERTVAQLQRVLDDAPGYFCRVTGSEARRNEAETLFAALPEGRSMDDKSLLGIYENGEMVGCADVIRAFPDSKKTTIGLLLIVETRQGKGIGRAAYHLVEERIVDRGSCSEIVLGVVRTNDQALAFWSKVGFAPNGTVKPFSNGSVSSELILLTKRLSSPG
jgi:ribosomal protein S18 acetylase RimI-like enzyme